MKDQDKTKQELIHELNELRQRVDELEALEKERKCVEDALRENEEMFRALAETVTSGIAVFQEEKYCYVNPAVTIITGYTQEELLVMHFWDFVHPDFKEVVRERGLARQRGETMPSRYEAKIVNKTGEIRWIDVAATSIKFKGVPAGLVSLLDITERKRAEEKVLRQSAVLDAINKVLLETLTCETDEEVACTSLAVAEELTGSKFGFIGEVDPRGRFDTLAQSNAGWNACKIPKSDAVMMIRDMEIRGIWGKVLKNEQSLIVNDPVSHPESVGTPEGHPSLTSFLGVPLKHAGKTFGMIALANKAFGYDLPVQKDIETLSVVFVEALKRKRAEEALRKSEANLSALIENTNDWICSVDSEYRILTMNRAWRNMFSFVYKIELKEGMNIMECFPPERRSFWAGVHDRALRGHHFTFGDHHDPEGISMDVDVSVNPIVRKDGETTGVSYFIRDITEQKQVERTLRESQELYRSLFEGVPVGLYRTMPGGEILDANQALVEMLGYPDLESFLVANLAHMHVVRDERKRWESLMEKDGIVRDFEARFRRKDGTVIWIRDTCRAVRNNDGQTLYHEGAIQDITGRKRAEEALRESEERYRTLFEESRDVIYITTREGRFIDINKSGLELFGYTKEEIMSLNVQDIYVDPHDRPRFQQEIECKGFVGDYEIKFRKKDGTEIDSLVTAIVQRANDGIILGYQGIIRDITERKQAEEELRSSREQLRALSAHLQSIREEERALIAREIHDELGQELTGLKMDLSWLIKRLPGDQEILVKKTESMSKLVDNTIQSVRRISTKLRPGVLDDLGLTAAIEWQAQDFQNRTGIECEFNSNLREVDLDRDRSTTVFRILQETLTNVARHASATRVNICLKEEEATLVLIVEDNGRGITKSEIFDPKSFGLLGMRERALVFGGEVEIRGTAGRGTTVTLKIPQQK
jgi:PAS domain S-box-containing protein